MFTATVYPKNDSPQSKNFQERHPAKSYAGWAFNRDDVQAVEVTDETGKVYLSLDKDSKERISIQ